MFFGLLGKLSTIDDVDRDICRQYLDAKSSVQDYSVIKLQFYLFYYFSLLHRR